LELIAAVAIGLNPYVGAFVVAGLAAFSSRVPVGTFGSAVPTSVITLAAILLGLAMPVDFVLGKFARFAPNVRRTSQYVAPVAGAFFTAYVSRSELPLTVVACGAAVLSWGVAAMLTSFAARASRSAAWVGLGHIPVLMAAATAAACIVPLGVAKIGIGLSLASIVVAGLLWATVSVQGVTFGAQRRRVRRLGGVPAALGVR
jgi:hypothetical protein